MRRTFASGSAPSPWILAALLALGGAGSLFAADEAADEFGGNFSLSYEPAKTAALGKYEKQLRASKLFDDTVAELNDTLALPAALGIVFGECGVINAFYDPQSKRVIVCYEMIDFLQRHFAQVYSDAAEAEQATVDATVFIFHHELGHALVDLLDIPITGKEEDAVDDLATLVLLHDWEDGDTSALNAAEAFYRIGELEEAAGEKTGESAIEALPFYDEHSLGKQRYYQIACIVYGSDPEAHKDLVGEDLPEERARRCPAEYQQKANSWGTLLADYYAAADQEDEGGP
jgi:hypothetical protein